LGTVPAWSTTSPAWVGEEGGTYGGIDWGLERWRKSSRVARALGTSKMAQATGKFLVGHFGNLTALVKTFWNYGCKGHATAYLYGNNISNE
jgi:hypothetical protein